MSPCFSTDLASEIPRKVTAGLIIAVSPVLQAISHIDATTAAAGSLKRLNATMSLEYPDRISIQMPIILFRTGRMLEQKRATIRTGNHALEKRLD
jgi:hypothetical protein